MDRTEQMAADIAIRLNGGEWKDGKWYSEGHREAWIRAVQLHADKIEWLMKTHDDMADEIERLREALRKISNSDICGCQMECVDMCKIANAAMKGDE